MADVTPSSLAFLLEQRPAEARTLRLAAALAIAAHLALFAVTWPDLTAPQPRQVALRVPVARLVAYRPPPPPREMPTLPQVRRVPVPDPSPLDPEPVRDLVTLPVDIPDVGDIVAAIPEDIPEPAAAVPVPDTVIAGNELAPPRAVFAPEPIYPDLARRAGIQGAVVLELLIDRSGAVADVTVIQPQPLGMTEAAVIAARRWRFEPSTFRGRPVNVIYRLTVSFRLR